MPKWRERLSMRVIRIGRQLIANTPIQRWPVTTAIYRRVFRLGYPAAEVTTQFRAETFSVPTSDVTLVPCDLGHDESIELDVFERMCESSQVVVDVGANIGIFTCLAARRVDGVGRVIAYLEPVEANRRVPSAEHLAERA